MARSAVPSSHSTPLTSSRRVPLSARVAERRRHEKDHEQISLDGVIQAPGGPNEDGDYPHGGWAVPHSDPAVGEAIDAGHGEAFDLLLGRRTYDIWSDYWPKAGKSPMDRQAGQSRMGSGRGPGRGRHGGCSRRQVKGRP